MKLTTKHVRHLVIFTLLFLFLLNGVYASTLYVSPDGNNDRTREEAQSIETPWGSIQYATDQLLPGDTLMILPGIYSGVVQVKSNGTAASRIVICNHPSGEVIIDGKWNGTTSPSFPVSYEEGGEIIKSWAPLWTVKGDYITIDGITWQNSPGRGISGDNVYGLIIKNFKIITTFSGALIVHTCTNSIVENGYIEDASAQYRVEGPASVSHVVAPVNSMNTIFRNLTIYRSGGEGIAGYTGYKTLIENVTLINNAKVAIYLNVSPKTTIRNCVVYYTDSFKPTAGDSRAIVIADEYEGEDRPNFGLTSDLVIENNLVINSVIGIWVGAGKNRAANLERVLIAHNTIRTKKGGTALILQNLQSTSESPRVWDDVYFENNIFDGEVSSSVTAENRSELYFSHNAWTGTPPSWMQSEYDRFDIIGYQGPSTLSIPVVESFNLTDYTLAPNSPLVNAGIDVTDVAGVTTIHKDFLGNPRDLLPDIGAFELTGIPAAAIDIIFKDPEIVIDGNSEDWESIEEQMIGLDKLATVPGEPDLSGSFKAAWSSEALYLWIKVNDQTIFEPTEQGQETDRIEMGMTFGHGDYYLALESPDDAGLVLEWGDSLMLSGNQLKEEGNAIEYVYNLFTGGYEVELRIPYSEIGTGLLPENGTLMWLEIALCDTDDGTAKLHELRWSGETDITSDMSGFGKITFTGKPVSMYSVTFNVKDESGTPLTGASVIFNGITLLSDGSGTALFTDIEPGENVVYTVTKQDYNPGTGSVSVIDRDIIVDVTLTAINTGLVSSGKSLKSIYPNPAIDQLFIENAGDIMCIRISNLAGKILKSINYDSGYLAKINIADLECGIYIVTLICSDGSKETGMFNKF